MIIRVFRPTIHPGKEQEFEAFLRDTAIPLVSQQAGLVAQHVGRPRDPSSTEYVYVTVWEDLESIRAFAGERWQEAVITPDEEHLLKDTWMGTTRSSLHPVRAVARAHHDVPPASAPAPGCSPSLGRPPGTAAVSLWPVARDNPGEMGGRVASRSRGRLVEVELLEAVRGGSQMLTRPSSWWGAKPVSARRAWSPS